MLTVCLDNKEYAKFWLPMWQIKFRVQSVSYPSIPVEQPKESKPFAPMVVTVSIFVFTILCLYILHYLGSYISLNTLIYMRYMASELCTMKVFMFFRVMV